MSLRVLMVAAFGAGVAMAQVPAGSTGACKDGTYTSAAMKDGACRGHKGVKDWYTETGGATTGAKSVAAAPVPTAMTPVTKTAVAPSTPMATAPAPRSAPMAAAPAPTRTAVKANPAGSGRQSPAAMAAARTQAPGGGPGMVWVNSSSKVYHCPGSDFYGKTEHGSYMSEADAKAQGGHADHNKPCTK
jgi:hypothetical protein